MKKLLLSLSFLACIQYSSHAQIRITEVHPQDDKFVLKNFSSTEQNISTLRMCALFVYDNLKTINGGSDVILAAGESIELTWSLNDIKSDLGLYKASGGFGIAGNMLDFVQYGGANNGREGVAVTAGLWGDDDFISSNIDMYFGGESSEHGVSFWSTTITAAEYQAFNISELSIANPMQVNTTTQLSLNNGEVVELYNTSGLKVATSSNGTLSTNGLVPGMYILTYSTNAGELKSTNIILQ